MSEKTTIEWTQSTWNPVTGCTKISAGCANCYAETFAERFRGVQGHPYEQGFDVRLWPERLRLPLEWKKPRRVFVNSMSDLFHPSVPDDFIESVFSVMNAASSHTFQVLTKRPERAVQLAPSLSWTGNIWMGVTIERQEYVDRAGWLVRIPAFLRFVSCEPMIGPIELRVDGLGWVIAGGESGPRARRMDPRWVRGLRAQCNASRIPFFFKQWGTYDESGQKVGKSRAGRELDGRTWDGVPQLKDEP